MRPPAGPDRLRRTAAAVLALVALCAGPAASAEADWLPAPTPDRTFYQTRFTADAGARFTIESSADLRNWHTDTWFHGLANQLTWNLVELPRPNGSTPVSDALPPGYTPPPQVTLVAHRVTRNLGTVLRWTSRTDGTPKVAVIANQNLHPRTRPVTAFATTGWHFFLALSSSLAANELPFPDPLAGADAAMVAAFTAAMPTLYQLVETRQDTAANTPPPPPPDPQRRRFFRLSRTDADSDGDGVLDTAEAAQGTLWLARDSDGDGLADDIDPAPLASDTRTDPDGAGLPATLSTGLAGRWDFEELETQAPGGFVSTPAATGSAQPFGAGWGTFGGLVAHGVDLGNAGTGYLSLPSQILNGATSLSICFWFKLPAGALTNMTRRMDLFGIGRSYDGGGDQVPLLAGYISTNRTLRIETQWLNYPDVRTLAAWSVPAQLADGGWHHFAFVKSNGRYSCYIDAVPIGPTSDTNSVTINYQYSPYFFLGRRDPADNSASSLKGSIDRLRVYRTALDQSRITALHNQDIDADGLFDRTEAPTFYWRDLDGSGDPSLYSYRISPNGGLLLWSEEAAYLLDPFRWDPPWADHDGDGYTSLDEQNIHLSDPADPADPGPIPTP